MQYTLNEIVNHLYNPVKALENEQRKMVIKHEQANNAYIKSYGDVEVQKGELSKIKTEADRFDCFLNNAVKNNHTQKIKEYATQLALYQKQYQELDAIIDENEESLELARKAIEAMKARIIRNEAKLSNLKIKQQMNASSKAMLQVLKIDKNTIGEVSFDSVEKQLTDEQHRINGERKAITKLNDIISVEDDDIDFLATQLIEKKQQALLEVNSINIDNVAVNSIASTNCVDAKIYR